MGSQTSVMSLLREGEPVFKIVLVLGPLYYRFEWARTDIGLGRTLEPVLNLLLTVIAVTGVVVILIYAVARGVHIGTRREGEGEEV